jgi:hypothetical protein
MIEIRDITTLTELQVLMPFFIEGYLEMNKRKQVFDIDQAGFVDTLIGVLNTVPRNVIGVAFDGDVPVGYGIAYEDTPSFCKERHLLMWALYAKRSHSKHVGPMIYKACENWAKASGYHYVHAFSSRFNGAAYHFFEQGLGMRRARIQFTKEIK